MNKVVIADIIMGIFSFLGISLCWFVLIYAAGEFWFRMKGL